jgi:hypothetical protein
LRYRVGANSAGPFFFRDREVIRRIFVTVRDAEWREVAPRFAEREDPLAGHVRFHASYESRHIDFDWRGSLEIEPEGEGLCFSIEGSVRRDGAICRLGLIVLLPPSVVTGAQVEAVANGQRHQRTIPDLLGPQPVRDRWPVALTEPFTALELSTADTRLSFVFEGEEFELEDQRNWGDASYKIYCTPLAQGFPRSVHAGQRIAHRVQVHFEVNELPVAPRFELLAPRPFPAIGVEASPTTSSDGRLWAHVACSLDEVADQPSGVRIELRVRPDDMGDLSQVERQLRLLGCRIVRLLLEGASEKPPHSKAVRILKGIASAAGISAPVLAAVRGYFVELNRGVPIESSADGIAWPMTPTVHSSDLETVLENATPFAPLVSHLERAGVCGPWAIAPLAWTYPARQPIADEPKNVALWLAATLLDAAEAGIESVTLSAELATHLASCSAAAAALAELITLSCRTVRPVKTEIEGVVAAVIRVGEPGAVLLAANTTATEHSLPIPARRPVQGGKTTLTLPARSLCRFAVAADREFNFQ